MNTCEHWSVEIKVDTESKLYISHNELSGVDNIMDYTEEIRNCANSLLGFIGELHDEPAPNGYTLVSVDGKAQKVVDRITLAPEVISFYVPEVQRRIHAEEIPVVCIEEREE